MERFVKEQARRVFVDGGIITPAEGKFWLGWEGVNAKGVM